MSQLAPAPRPIVVNATPAKEQAAALVRQLLIGVSGFGLGVWVAKDTHLIPDLESFAQPMLGALSGIAGSASIILGQMKTRIASEVAARLANMLPDELATTKSGELIPFPTAKPPPIPVATPAPAPSPARPFPMGQMAAETGKITPLTNTPRPIPAFLIPYLERVEGERTHAYQDSRGRWTIGTGHTGPDVGPGVVWTQAMINAALQADLAIAVGRLEAAIGRAIIWTLTASEYAALLSFVFNVGEIETWRIWVDIRASDLADVPAEMGRFVYSNGVKVDGLVNRRADDVALWNGQAPEVRLAA